MKTKFFNIIILILSAILIGCYPKPSLLAFLPSAIDYKLLGGWEIKAELIDVGVGTQIIEFRKDRYVQYKHFYNDYLGKDISGEYRVNADTLYILFKGKTILEVYLYKITDNTLSLKNVKAEDGATIEKYITRKPYWYKIF